MSQSMSQSIQAIKFKTSNPEKFAILVGSTEEKVDNSQFNKGMIICLDSSGSMNAYFTDPDLLASTNHDVDVSNLPHTTPLSSVPYPTSSSKSFFNLYSTAPTPYNDSQTPFFSGDTQVQDDIYDDSSMFQTPFSTMPYDDSSQRKPSITPNTRLSCVDSFMSKIFDLFDFVQKTQGITVPLSVVVFGTKVQVITNLEEPISYQKMKHKTSKALTQGGGTNYELAINETKRLKPKYSGEVTTIFLSDGGHADHNLNKEQLVENYPNFFNYCIGVGEGDSDYDESTLKSIGEEFIRGTSPQRIRDFVASIALGIATMRAKNITISSTNPSDIIIGNMEKKFGRYCKKEMSMLMELYFSVTNSANITIEYEKSDSKKMEIKIDESTPIEDDIEFGDKVLHTMEILEFISKISETTKDMTSVEKLQCLSEYKKSIIESTISQCCPATRIHNYYLSVVHSIDKMILTRDERKLRDLARNVKSDVFNNVSSTGADLFCSPGGNVFSTPLSQMTPISPFFNTNKITNVKCNICCINDRQIVFTPCGHYLSCSCCSLNPKILDEGCPYCRSKIEGVIPVVLDSEQKKDDWDMICKSCNREHVSCISKDCSHIFSCIKCIERQKRHVKRDKARMQCLDTQIFELLKEGKDVTLLESEKKQLENTKNYVQCTVCNMKCTAFVEVHI